MPGRRAAAAALWFLLAFLVWNVRFDMGVRVAAGTYLDQRVRYLRGAGPRIEMSSSMRAGVRASARAATVIALPFLGVAAALGAAAVSRSSRVTPP
jgi:hypothetical protein